MYRERLLENLLKTFLPRHIETGTGFIIGRKGDTSTQVDIVLFDADETPKVEDAAFRRFYPLETIVAVGEVKSSLKKSEIVNVLKKLRKVKELTRDGPETPIPVRPSWRAAEVVIEQAKHRIQIEQDKKRGHCKKSVSDRMHELLREDYNPIENHWQNKVSFVVCSDIAGGSKAMKDEITSFTSRVTSEDEASMDHNMFLSLADGYQTYAHNGKAHLYPRVMMNDGTTNARATMSFIAADDDCNHIIAFVSDLCSAVSDVAVYPFRITDHVELTREHIKW
ncbi:hypothetical protein BXY66_2937 [Shimia isoporae]|uniref:DUF6602 domain-containing protein n=2 Tax=Shimia isoporae TaxID=647720 RepID=A0A4V2Q287_9RHOB|nr:hypothetical protein BXY66_2937 [Shimia isoporae]